MTRVVFIGGVGSNTRSIDVVLQALTRKYDTEVIAMSFNEALADLAYVAQIVRGSVVVTHSAGVSLIEDMTPARVIAVAPPMPASIPVALVRMVKKTIALHKSGIEPERRDKIWHYHVATLRENLTKPHFLVRQASAICRFNTATVAIKLLHRDIPVTLGLMQNDDLFPNTIRHHHILTAKAHGVEVYELKGHHDEFLLYPQEILACITL